jgi:hypothetical protein
MAPLTVISDEGATETDASVEGSHVWVQPASVELVLGWEVKPEGLCRGDVCIPGTAASTRAEDGRVDLVAVAGALHRPVLLDGEAAALVVGASASDRSQALRDKQLPRFTLPDLDGRTHDSDEWRGAKLLLVAFASW